MLDVSERRLSMSCLKDSERALRSRSLQSSLRVGRRIEGTGAKLLSCRTVSFCKTAKSLQGSSPSIGQGSGKELLASPLRQVFQCVSLQSRPKLSNSIRYRVYEDICSGSPHITTAAETPRPFQVAATACTGLGIVMSMDRGPCKHPSPHARSQSLKC